MKPTISSHYSNDNHSHYEFARRADPPWYPDSRISVDAMVMIATCIFAFGTALFVWYMESGL
jgi:hypothetical protein